MNYISGLFSYCCYWKQPAAAREYPSKFAEYVATHCPGYTLDSAFSLVEKGEQFITAMNQGSYLPEDSKEYLSAFMWSLMYRASENNQGFSQGTFVVHDPQSTLERFFAGSKLCYRRLCSHYPKRTRTDSIWSFYANTYAIDLP